jgi:hypothetical protein
MINRQFANHSRALPPGPRAKRPSRLPMAGSLARSAGGSPIVAIGATSHHFLAALAIWAAVTITLAIIRVTTVQLSRLYWASGYMRLLRKGISLATTVSEVRGLMAGLTEATMPAPRDADPDAGGLA